MANPLALRWGPLSLLMDLDSGACKQLRWTERDNDNPVDLLAWHQPQPIHKPFEVGSFVLVPYSNRLFDSKLLSPSGTFTLPANYPSSNVPVHGLGWRKKWQCVTREPQRVVLVYSHLSDDHWPFAHNCEQTVTLNQGQVEFHLKVKNNGEQPMPAGLGFHPWFALDHASQVRFGPTSVWLQDERGWPTVKTSSSGLENFDFTEWRSAQTVIQNHCHSDWSGRADLHLHEKKLSIQLTASSNLNHLIVYRKPGQDWLCLEPVSHATGAFSLPHVKMSQAGDHLLAPGDSMEAWMRISVKPLTH